VPWLAIVAAACCLLASGEVMALDIEAHRGGRALFPENTLPSFANALTMGVDTLELDIGITQDEAIVVSHERGLTPTSPARPTASMSRHQAFPLSGCGSTRSGNTTSASFAPAAPTPRNFPSSARCRERRSRH
jgi:glycerophosphoryl diester phosphodiesterase